MIKFTTVNVDGMVVTREFNTLEEIRSDYYSDDCTLPANDDKVLYAELDGVQLHYPATFEDLIDELGIGPDSTKEEEAKISFGSRGFICVACSGQGIASFASEMVAMRKKELGVLVGVFNDIALFVHTHDTVQDVISQYYAKR